MKHDGSSSASDSSPCRKGHRRHRHPELYYEERWVERRTRRKSNSKKLARRDSRSFSEEEVRLSKTSTKKDERRARSESARYDDNGNSGRNPRRKRSRRISMSHKREYSDSSIESDSCDYSHDDDETEATVQRQRAKMQQETRRNKSKSSNETTAKDSSKKEDNDDNQSVSDDSLEVIVVKKSLEKKCEKMVSGRRSKTPRECTKETKLTKMHKRSSKKTSRSGKSKRSDNDENAVARDDSPDKKEKSAAIREPMRTSGTPLEEDEVDERIIESRYRRDATDSTSQETVEQVIVTAMVHKDQMPDTPKSTLDTAREISYQDVLKKKTMETEETKEISRDITTSDKNETASSHKMDRQDVSGESVPKGTQENSEITEEIQDEDERAKKTNDEMQDRLDTSEDVTPSNDTHEKQKTDEDKIPDKLSYLSIEPNATEESINERRDSSKDEEKTDKQSVLDQKDLSQHSITMDEESGKSISEDSKREENAKTAPKKTSSDNEESKTPSSRKLEVHETASSVQKNKITGQTGEEEGETLTKQISMKTVAKESSESIEDAKSKEDENLNKHDEKSTGVSSTESMLNVKETLSPERTLHDKNSENVNGSDNREQSEIETRGKDSYSIDDSCSSSPKSLKPVKTRRSRPSTGRNVRTGRSSSNVLTKKHLFESSEECSPHQRAIVAVIDSPEWDEDEAVEQEIRQALGEDTLERDTEHEEDNEIGVMRVLPSTSEEETPSTTLDTSRTARIDSLPQIQSTTSNRLVTIENSDHAHRERFWRKQRRDSGGRDSGIEPSPRVSRIPRRRNARCCPNTAKQQALNMETITRDVQISLRRYYLERKIFFQLMELKRLQIRHGRANEHVLVKRQVEAFNRSGMSGPILGVAKYDQPLTFRQFEAFLYEQLRRLQGRPTTPDFCTEAKQCTQKTHRCHHATSAYTSIPVYTYLGGDAPDRAEHLPKIESRGRGHMTVEVTHGEEKQVIALPTEKLDRTKKYFVTFTVRGETQDDEKSKSSCIRRNAKSV